MNHHEGEQMTTTNPSLAVDNDAERRFKAFRDAHIAIDVFETEHEAQRATLEAENARLRAALTEAERDIMGAADLASMLEIQELKRALAEERKQVDEKVLYLRDALAESERARAEAMLALEVSLKTTAETLERAQGAEFALVESERARAILAKQLDEEVARLPRLRQEQTAEIERLRSALADSDRWHDEVMAEKLRAIGYDNATATWGPLAEHKARIAELEAEVARLKTQAVYWNCTACSASHAYGDEAFCAACLSVAREHLRPAAPAPAAPAVPVIEPGSRWRDDEGKLTVLDVAAVRYRRDDWRVSVTVSAEEFRARFTRLPDEAKPAGET